MSGATFSDLESFGLLKELYLDDVKYQDHVQSSLYGFLKKADSNEVEFDGNYFNVPVQFALNESYAAIQDNERLPEADFPKGVFARYRVKQMYSTVEMTTFAATRGHKDGRPNGKYLDDTMKGTLLSFMSNLDFDLYSNGRGFRATVSTAVPAATSFVVASSMRLRAGMKLDWYDSTLVTKRGSIKIDVKAIDRQNKTVYLDASFGGGVVPAGAVAGDVLVVYNALAAGEPSDGRHIAGLDRITDNTVSLGTLSPSNYALWMATNQDAAGANPSQEILQIQWDNLYQVSGVYPNKMVFAPSWKRGYLAQFLNQRRFTSNSFDTGASSLSFSPLKMGSDEKNKKPGEFQMLEDKNCTPTSVYIWNSEAVVCAHDYSDTPHLADEDGNEFRFRVGYDALAGFYRFWMNTVVYQRNAIGKISGFASQSGTI
jgi:hypothetical protein